MRNRIVFCLGLFLILLSFNAFTKDLTQPDNEIAVLQTNYGPIVIEFFPVAAPNHVANFKKLSRSGFYNGTQFHRVISGFMIQGGDPNSKDSDPSNDGTGNTGQFLKAEFSAIPHKRGIVSMARAQDPNSASCQFFIMHADAPNLDGQYSVFGRVIRGMDTVDKIAAVKTVRDHPVKPVVIQKVKIEKRTATAKSKTPK